MENAVGATFKAKRKQDIQGLKAAVSFRTDCLLSDGSLLFGEQPIWRLDVL